MRASTMGKLRTKGLDIRSSISNESHTNDMQRLRGVHTCTDEETTLYCDILGHESCYVISGAVRKNKSVTIRKGYG